MKFQIPNLLLLEKEGQPDAHMDNWKPIYPLTFINVKLEV